MQGLEDFELERELGRGATARVFLARHRETKELVSLKLFHPHVHQDALFAERIRRELALTSSLTHEGIVRVRGYLDSADSPALLMDYVEGENLEKFQARLPYVLPELSAGILVRVLEALGYAHEQGLVHRDLKPENILVDSRARLFITDFGLARNLNGSRITLTNFVVGTVDYMSPEQVRGDVLDERSDLYSVAAILYFLTTGTRPFSRSSTVATLAAVEREEPEPPQRRNPKLSAPLVRIICKGLSKDRAKRFQSAAEFRIALEEYLDGLALLDFRLLSVWLKDPAAGTLEGLQLSSHRLISRAERALRQNRREEFLECLAHLSLKAPDSPALDRLRGAYRAGRDKKRWVWFFAGASVAAGGLLCLYLWPDSKPAPPSPVAGPPSIPARTSVPAPVSPNFASPVLMSPSPAPTGTVIFKVARDVTVYWDGRKVDTGKPLNDQRLGKHFMLLQRPSHEPIRAEVVVKADEPTIINAR